jgi:hypothetical protein
MKKQIVDRGGATFYQDTSAIHFTIPVTNGNLWGKVLLTSNSIYKLRLIKERAFENTVIFDADQTVGFDDYVEKVELPPRITFIPNSVITRAAYSKFNHYTFTYNTKEGNTYRQKLMGPYWDLKIEIQDEEGKVDKRVSYVEIQESYYRAAMKAGGTIVKNRARETVFSLPGDEFTTWVRTMVTMDGVYFLRIIKVSPEDHQEPELFYTRPSKDSIPDQTKK